MTHLVPSKDRIQRNSSAEVSDYRLPARSPQAQNRGNSPVLFYKISHTAFCLALMAAGAARTGTASLCPQMAPCRIRPGRTRHALLRPAAPHGPGCPAPRALPSPAHRPGRCCRVPACLFSLPSLIWTTALPAPSPASDGDRQTDLDKRFFRGGWGSGGRPVSYTHLDVYKRQIIY